MIDYVIPFVDDSDAAWQEVYGKYCDDILDGGRWRDWGILKYQLRSIEKYMPFIDRIFIVLSVGSSQIPQWLNTDNPRIKIVYDYEFMPKEVLPVFNSNAIELYFPRIKDLSEHYLTACDDYLIMRGFKEEDFFKDDKIKLKIENAQLKSGIYGTTVANSVRMIFPYGVIEEDNKIKCLWANHTVTPHIKSINEAFLSKHEEEIYNSLTRERDSKNLTWLVYSLNMMKLNKLEQSDIKVGCKRLKCNEDICNLTLDGCDIAVLNDWYDDWEYKTIRNILIDKLNKIFPDKSQFEI